MSINYNSIKDLVSLLYNFVYNYDKEIISNYIYVKFDLNEIEISDLIGNEFNYQLILNSNYDSKENFKITNIFGDMIYKKIILKKYFKDFPLTLIIQKYKTNEIPINITDITYELFINQILTEFIIIEKVPFFLLNICNFNISLSNISNYQEFYNLLVKEFKIYDPNDLDSKFCISVYEHYHSYLNFKDFLKEKLSSDDIKLMFFQLFYVYAYLITKLDNFYHGDYTTNSFLIMKNNNLLSNIKLNLGNTVFLLEKPKYIFK